MSEAEVHQIFGHDTLEEQKLGTGAAGFITSLVADITDARVRAERDR